MMKSKKIVDVRDGNVKRQREWEFAQANYYSESSWIRDQFRSTLSHDEVLVKTPFKDWYGDWILFKIGTDREEELFLHDDGYYLNQLEANHADIFPEVKQRFFENNTKMHFEYKHGFLLKRTGCSDKESPNFIFQMQQYCLELAHLAKLVIEADQGSKLKVEMRS